MKAEAIIAQAEEFKTKHGEYPKYPIRIRYKFMSTHAEGDLKGTSIFGYPGMVGATDNEVTELVMLYDADKRNFPLYDEEVASTKKKEEKILEQEPLATLSKIDLDSLLKLYKEAQTTQRFGVKAST